MTNYEEMLKRAKEMTYEELEEARFYNEMVERWTPTNYTWNNIITNEMRTRTH